MTKKLLSKKKLYALLALLLIAAAVFADSPDIISKGTYAFQKIQIDEKTGEAVRLPDEYTNQTFVLYEDIDYFDLFNPYSTADLLEVPAALSDPVEDMQIRGTAYAFLNEVGDMSILFPADEMHFISVSLTLDGIVGWEEIGEEYSAPIALQFVDPKPREYDIVIDSEGFFPEWLLWGKEDFYDAEGYEDYGYDDYYWEEPYHYGLATLENLTIYEGILYLEFEMDGYIYSYEYNFMDSDRSLEEICGSDIELLNPEDASPNYDLVGSFFFIRGENTDLYELAYFDPPKFAFLGDKNAEYWFQLAALQEAFLFYDYYTIASFLDYPLIISKGETRYAVADSEQFLEIADDIITPELVDVIGRSLISELHADAYGIMLGEGEIWLNPVDGVLAIYAMNLF